MWTEVASPVGDLLLTAEGSALTGVWFDGDDEAPRPGERTNHDPVLVAAAEQLAAYFIGTLTRFDLPLAAAGTSFQQRVWTALRGIPYGTTVSYGDVARELGLPPGASRAVGLADGANPIAIVVPCHRVIGADGRLTGYGGGLDRKRFLLDLERGALF